MLAVAALYYRYTIVVVVDISHTLFCDENNYGSAILSYFAVVFLHGQCFSPGNIDII
jgi:hypothetical protein